MGGMFSKPSVDKSALRAAEEERRRAAEEAAAAETKKKALEEAEKKRKAHVASSGREASILAGENQSNGKNLLGG